MEMLGILGVKPAGGAATSEVLIATAIALLLMGAMLAVVIGHRTGRLTVLGRLAGASSRSNGQPTWASLPADVLSVALLVAVLGMYWDISFHLDDGRDPGPLSNPAHYLILLGLFGVFFSGLLALALPLRRPSRTSVRLARGWQVPLGGLLIAFCAGIALIAFPLDDMWHRAFGQDVTLWGPTHLLLIGGAAAATLGMWVLHVEGVKWRSGEDAPAPTKLTRIGEVGIPGSVLIGLSTFQAEFDFGVPQFRLVLHPTLIMLAAGIALVAARVRIGRGGALAAVGLFLLVRGGLAVTVGPVLGNTTPHFPLYVVEALLVELVAFRVSPRRPLAFGAAAGVAIGTVGLGAEWAWSHVWGTIPWPASMAVEGALLGFAAALAGGVVGGFVGGALNGDRLGSRGQRAAAAVAMLAVVGTVLWGLPRPTGESPPRATVTLTELDPAPRRTVAATVRLEPANAADDARWLNATSWQGGGSVVHPLRRIGPGRYRATHPIPVHGDWKTTLRLQRGRAVLGLPLYMPADPAIPARAVPAAPRFTREFVSDHELLLREQKQGVPAALSGTAYTVVFALFGSMLVALGLALLRLVATAGGARPASPSPPPAPLGAPARAGR